MSDKYEKMSVFEQIRAGLEDSIAHTRGKLSLKTTVLPAPPPQASAGEIRALRRQLKMSQAVFAATLNVSIKTVQSWEQGVRAPSDAALRLIQIAGLRPTLFLRLVSEEEHAGVKRGAAKRANYPNLKSNLVHKKKAAE